MESSSDASRPHIGNDVDGEWMRLVLEFGLVWLEFAENDVPVTRNSDGDNIGESWAMNRARSIFVTRIIGVKYALVSMPPRAWLAGTFSTPSARQSTYRASPGPGPSRKSFAPN